MPDRTGVEHAEQVGAGGMAPAVPCDAIGCDRSSCKGGRSVTLMAGQSAVFSRCGCAGESGNRLTADSSRGVLAILQGEEQDGLVPAWQMGERAVLGEHDAAGDQRLRAHRTDRTAHLRRLLRGYSAYYNTARPHQSLDNNSPQPRVVEPPPRGRIVAIPQVGVLHRPSPPQSAESAVRHRSPPISRSGAFEIGHRSLLGLPGPTDPSAQAAANRAELA